MRARTRASAVVCFALAPMSYPISSLMSSRLVWSAYSHATPSCSDGTPDAPIPPPRHSQCRPSPPSRWARVQKPTSFRFRRRRLWWNARQTVSLYVVVRTGARFNIGVGSENAPTGGAAPECSVGRTRERRVQSLHAREEAESSARTCARCCSCLRWREG